MTHSSIYGSVLNWLAGSVHFVGAYSRLRPWPEQLGLLLSAPVVTEPICPHDEGTEHDRK